MPEPTTCKHCGARIVSFNYSTGSEWMHQPAGASFSAGVYRYRYCKKTSAAPAEPHSHTFILTPRDGGVWKCGCGEVVTSEELQKVLDERGMTTRAESDTTDRRPHSRACGWRNHDHGIDCSPNCPTCGGKELP